jgi:hypothetical protein
MSSENAGPQEQVVPEEEWGETLSRFEMAHKGRRVSVQIEEPDGRRTQLESEDRFELGLMGVRKEERGEQLRVRLVVHKHPGAKIEAVEIDEPTRILQHDGLLVVETENGRRVLIQSFPA